jgi:hypothetical protein
MGLDLTPRNYLEMLTDEYREYRDNRLSMRKAINCCGLSNALPEVITAHHNPTDRKISRTRLIPTAISYTAMPSSSHRSRFLRIQQARKVETQICERGRRPSASSKQKAPPWG